MLVVLYTTGIRRGEMSNLTWADLDFEHCILHVARHSAGGHVQKWTPKDHERREVPLPEKAIEFLRQWNEHAPKDCPYVFMDLDRWEYYRLCVDRKTWLAGHADIKTTQKYYLSVQDEDLQAARAAQQEIVGGLASAVATDHLLTNSAQKRALPKRKVFHDGTQLPSETDVA